MTVFYFTISALGETIGFWLRAFTHITKQSTARTTFNVYSSILGYFIFCFYYTCMTTIISAPLTNGETFFTIVKFAVLALDIYLWVWILAFFIISIMTIGFWNFQFYSSLLRFWLNWLQVFIFTYFVIQYFHSLT